MGEAKFTPGPWRMARWSEEREQARIEMDCNHPEGWAWSGWVSIRTEANAHLIAAAPDLYEQLEYAVKCIEWMRPRLPKTPQTDAGGIPAEVFMRAALAKARGEA